MPIKVHGRVLSEVPLSEMNSIPINEIQPRGLYIPKSKTVSISIAQICKIVEGSFE